MSMQIKFLYYTDIVSKDLFSAINKFSLEHTLLTIYLGQLKIENFKNRKLNRREIEEF